MKFFALAGIPVVSFLLTASAGIPADTARKENRDTTGTLPADTSEVVIARILRHMPQNYHYTTPVKKMDVNSRMPILKADSLVACRMPVLRFFPENRDSTGRPGIKK